MVKCNYNNTSFNGLFYIFIFIFIFIIVYIYFNYRIFEYFEDLKQYNDYGSQCTATTYDRGIGTIPLVGACPAGTRSTPTDCWEDPGASQAMYIPSPGLVYTPDISIYGNGCSNHCDSGYQNDGPCFCRKVECHINTSDYSKGRRDDYIAGLCYQICPPGYHRDGLGCRLDTCPSDKPYEVAGVCWAGRGIIVKNLAQRQYCPEGRVLEVGLCYNKCKTGFKMDPGIPTQCKADVPSPIIKKRTPLVKGTPLKIIDINTGSFQRDSVYEADFKAPMSC